MYTVQPYLYLKELWLSGLRISLPSPSGGGRHWSRVNDGSVTDSLEVEMTSYILLALMSGPPLSGFDLGYSSSIVQWLSQQQNAFGGFASTQVQMAFLSVTLHLPHLNSTQITCRNTAESNLMWPVVVVFYNVLNRKVNLFTFTFI